MTRQWAPGDVAVDGGGNRLLAARRANGSLVWQNAFGGFYPIDGLIEDARPLVVIDPESLIRDNEADDRGKVWELVNCLRRIAEADGDGQTWRARLVSRIADEAEKQLRWPPRPAEPTGAGAVVEDADGHTWVRTLRHDSPDWWYSDHGSSTPHWTAIHAVRVLSEGVA